MLERMEKVVRISISLPPVLDAQMRKLARVNNVSLSQVYREAALLKLRGKQ